jgi:hypothetical protein
MRQAVRSIWKEKSKTDSETLIKHLVPTPPDAPGNPLHAYRSLLRALSYFPDPYARKAIQEDVRQRFEKHKVEKSSRLKLRLKKANASVQCIERANQGTTEDIETVLQNAYGKKGRRRRVLLRELLQPGEDDLPQDKSALEEIIAGNFTGKSPAAANFKTPAKCKALIESFRREIPAELQRGTKRPPKTELKIPKTLWGREMPLKRQANIQREWWALTLEKLYPPLPEHEWNRLRDLSTGRIPIETPIPKRKRSKLEDRLGSEENQMVLKHLLDPARAKGKLAFAEGRGLYVATEDSDIDQKPPRIGSDYQRTMRRIYGAIWQTSAKMHRDPTTKDWVVEWGEKLSPTHYGEFPIPCTEESRWLEKEWKMPPDGGPHTPEKGPRRPQVVEKTGV